MTDSTELGAVDVTVVMPAFNEAEILEATVDEVVAGLRARRLRFEVLVVENGSTDSTARIALDLARRIDEVRVEQLDQADYGRALRRGLLEAHGAVVANFDVDYFDLTFLDAALERVGPGGAAIVVGSKRAHGSDDSRSMLRRTVTGVFSTVLRLGFGLSVSDTHGMKAMDRSSVLDHARRCELGADLFDTELILRVERAGLRTEEIPVRVAELRPARTSILRRAPRAAVGLVRLRIVLARHP